RRIAAYRVAPGMSQPEVARVIGAALGSRHDVIQRGRPRVGTLVLAGRALVADLAHPAIALIDVAASSGGNLKLLSTPARVVRLLSAPGRAVAHGGRSVTADGQEALFAPSARSLNEDGPPERLRIADRRRTARQWSPRYRTDQLAAILGPAAEL